jgi:hypothetical protein
MIILSHKNILVIQFNYLLHPYNESTFHPLPHRFSVEGDSDFFLSQVNVLFDEEYKKLKSYGLDPLKKTKILDIGWYISWSTYV